jgi:hypothetical protein
VTGASSKDHGLTKPLPGGIVVVYLRIPRCPCNGMKAHHRFLVGSSDLVRESYIPIQQWETQMSFPGLKKKAQYKQISHLHSTQQRRISN